MIPAMYITASSNVVPWAIQRQVEQDLIISRVIVDIFGDPVLREELRFRGGTALNKLHFPHVGWTDRAHSRPAAGRTGTVARTGAVRSESRRS